MNRRGTADKAQAEAGTICYVHSTNRVNVAGFNAEGHPFRERNVHLVSEGLPGDEVYAVLRDRPQNGYTAQRAIAKHNLAAAVMDAPVSPSLEPGTYGDAVAVRGETP